MRHNSQFVILCVAAFLSACIPASGYGVWDNEREGSILEVADSWTEAPSTPPATPPSTPTRPATPPATVPATPFPPTSPVTEAPVSPVAPDCTLRFLTTFDWTSISPTEGVVHYDIRKSMFVAWRAACDFVDPQFTWTITGLPGITSSNEQNITLTSAQLQSVFVGDENTQSKEITITLAISATSTVANVPVNPNPVTLKAILYQPPQKVSEAADFVTEPTAPVPFRNNLGLTFHKSTIKFGSSYSVSYALSAASDATKFGFGIFKGTWGTDDETIQLPVPITTEQQENLVQGKDVPSINLWCYLYVQNDQFVGTYFGPFQVTIAGQAAITKEEAAVVAEEILEEKFATDPFAAVTYYLGAVGGALSEERQAHFLELAYSALDTVVADTTVSPSPPSVKAPTTNNAAELIDQARAAKIAEMPPATQLQLIDSFKNLIATDKSLEALNSGSGSSGSSSGAVVTRASVIRALQVADMLLAASIAVKTSGLTEAVKNSITTGVGMVLRLVTAYASVHFGVVAPAPPTKSGVSPPTSTKSTGLSRQAAKFAELGHKFVSQAALDAAIRRALNTLENVAKAGVTVNTVTKTSSECGAATPSLKDCYFFAESYIVDPGRYAELAEKFEGIADVGGLANYLTTLGHGTLIVMYTSINNPNLFDTTFDPALGIFPVKTFGGSARLELFLPEVGSARLQPGERLPIQLPEGTVAPQLIIPGLTPAAIPENAITVRRSFTDNMWVKTSGSAVRPADEFTVSGAGYRIVDYFWSVAAQPPAPAVPPSTAPSVVTPSVVNRPSVQPIAPIVPNTQRSTVEEDDKGSSGTAVGVGVGVGVGAFVLIVLILIALYVRRRNSKDDYTDPEFVVGKDQVWNSDPLMGQALENGHFAPPPTPSPATYTSHVGGPYDV